MSFYSPYANKLGSHVDTAGTKVTISSTKILQSKNGEEDLKTLTIDIPDILLPTFKHIPTGGVTSPIARPTTNIIPKVISLIPSVVNTGNIIGAINRIHGTTSKNVPKRRIRISKSKKIIHVGIFELKIKFAIASGTCLIAKI